MNGPRPHVIVVVGSIPLYGLELALIDVGCMLRDAGAEVLFVTNAHWGHVAVEPRLDALGLPHDGVVFFGSVERGIGSRRLVALLRLFVSENLRFWRILRRFRATDVHVGTHWDAFNLWPALWLARVRVHLQLHNAPVIKHRLLRVFWRALLRRCVSVVAVSRYVAARLLAAGAGAADIVVVPNRVPQRPHSAIPTEVPRAAATVFAFVGQISAIKGVDHLLDAVAALASEGHDVACHVLGDHRSPWATALRERIASGPASARIHFQGYVADPMPLLRAADVLVAPSLCEEAFGMVVAEAKSAGRPAIVYDDGALAELVVDGVDGRVVPRGDAGALLAAMRVYAIDPGLARVHGEAAKHSMRTLGIHGVAQRWAAIYGLPA